MSKKEKKISFEEALHELEVIVENLERGNLSLEDSIQAYEKAIELKQSCQKILSDAEGKIIQLSSQEEGIKSKENSKKSAKKNSTFDDVEELF